MTALRRAELIEQVLAVLRASRSASATDLSDEIRARRSTLIALVRELERGGRVVRVAGRSGRDRWAMAPDGSDRRPTVPVLDVPDRLCTIEEVQFTPDTEYARQSAALAAVFARLELTLEEGDRLIASWRESRPVDHAEFGRWLTIAVLTHEQRKIFPCPN